MVFLETGLNRDGVLGTDPWGVPAHPVTFSFHNCSWFCEVAGFQRCCRAGEKGVQLRQSLQNQLCLQRFRCCFLNTYSVGYCGTLVIFQSLGPLSPAPHCSYRETFTLPFGKFMCVVLFYFYLVLVLGAKECHMFMVSLLITACPL